ncbi:MAG TPA: DUF2267 domain-containing protein [Polyangia bacterium]|nr:DUF2267 domain-containing protein [Polyangia bacterium]
MRLDRFLTLVEECIGGGALPGELVCEEAARTAHAVLAALALRLSPDDRRRLAGELPPELRGELESLDIETEGEPPLGDTIGRVAAELDIDEEIAARRVCCVVTTLKDAVSDDTWRALPQDLEQFGAGD